MPIPSDHRDPASAPQLGPAASPQTLSARLLQFVRAPLEEIDAQHRAYLASPQGRAPDARAICILVVVAAMLALRYYWFSQTAFEDLIEFLLPRLGESWRAAADDFLSDPQNRQLARLLYWCLGQVLVYVVIPVLLIRYAFRERLSDYGARLRGSLSGWPIYLAMFAVMIPLIALASQRPSFLHTYPFYRPASGEPFWPRLFIWELVYAVQFISLEFFFRGFMLLGLARRFGVYSIFVMTIPYCMIHFGKPLPETLAAIVAGVVLGFMALKTRSVWLGALLHIAVAWSMDWCAVSRLALAPH